MKKFLLSSLLAFPLLFLPLLNFAQAPSLGTAANYVLFSTDGAVSNTGISQITGNVGTNNGSSTAFGNVNGGMHDGDGNSAQCAADLLIAYNQLNAVVADFFISPLLGNGDTLIAGAYSISGASTMNLNLFLDAEGDSNAEFIFLIQGSLSTNAASKVRLINGAQACKVFWKIEGAVSLASGTSMKGTIIANNAAISTATDCELEGRALSTTGAVGVDGIFAYTPIGCGSPVLTGPTPPTMGTTECFGLFTSDGGVTNSGITTVMGDIGTNAGSVSGYDPLLVTGTIHGAPDSSTGNCASDLQVVYNYLNLLPTDIELLYPAQFGNNLVLTPHTYLLGAAVTFTDSLYLNAQGNTDAVFVIKINGALGTSTNSKVLLINGTQAKNVYWKIEGAVEINNYSVFVGSIICNNGAMSVMNTGVALNGRALTTSGAITTDAISTTMDPNCTATGISPFTAPEVITVQLYPNPFSSFIRVVIDKDAQLEQAELSIYNLEGTELINTAVTKGKTTIETNQLSPGIYFYRVTSSNKIIQTGKLVSIR